MIRKGGDTCMGFSLNCITNINRIFRNLAKESFHYSGANIFGLVN